MLLRRGRERRRIPEHVVTDPFIDVAFVYTLIKDSERLDVIKRQAQVYVDIGSKGVETATFKKYKDEATSFIIEAFGAVYKNVDKELERKFAGYDDKTVAQVKAERAWTSLIALLASAMLMKRAGVGIGYFIPSQYADISRLKPILKVLIYEKARSRGRAASWVLEAALKDLGVDRKLEELAEIAPTLWWVNLIMESEIIEGLLKFHYLTYVFRDRINAFVAEVEDALSTIEEHQADYDYGELEVLKGLLSRCVELRGQYINKLQNALLFIKILRPSVLKIAKPEQWEWFIKDETLTYATMVYLAETQRLSGAGGISLSITRLLEPKKGVYAGVASALASLLALSPVFMQYNIEARGKAVITPADIVVAVLRLIGRHGRARDFTVSVEDAVEEIIQFWREADILRRVSIYAEEDATQDMQHILDSFNASMALLLSTGIDGVHPVTSKRALLKLPPRMIAYDSLFVRPNAFFEMVRKVWGG
ncbi:hypothetical protein apy_08940 [Aeropyrum pernix]|uniref:Uncharacterized protein n=1 Tax=Aeropyrum pernix TaxID=56636 RepID=A0A401HA14_AERPX|nr:hypothetical protein apy_08940 [Aeropyrum pernix]